MLKSARGVWLKSATEGRLEKQGANYCWAHKILCREGMTQNAKSVSFCLGNGEDVSEKSLEKVGMAGVLAEGGKGVQRVGVGSNE